MLIFDYYLFMAQIWLEREKRMSKETQAHYESKISDLKRQLSHQKYATIFHARNIIALEMPLVLH